MSSFFIASMWWMRICEYSEGKLGNNDVDISIRALDQASGTLNNIANSLRTLQGAAGGMGQTMDTHAASVSRADLAWAAFAGT